MSTASPFTTPSAPPSPASKLAYIGRVEVIEPIVGADRIELATVDCGEGGRWSGVVKKGDFVVGDCCTVYLQDAVVPESSGLDFLKSSGWRVKMARFRGAPSECVITGALAGEESWVGRDVTGLLGVTKYEKKLPACLSGDAVGNFPSFIPKTDEPNFQTAGRLLAALRGQPWVATVKCDGSSTTAYRWQGKFGVCSRNLELKESECAYWRVAKKYGLDLKLPEGVALQWETVGPGIQKNPMGLSEVDGRVFNGWRIDERRYLNHAELQDLCLAIGIPQVMCVEVGEEFDLDSDGMRRLAEGTYPNGKQREGVVVRPQVEQWVGQARLSFKVINLLYKD
jgi:RNA ligase (TIGR02306 family)